MRQKAKTKKRPGPGRPEFEPTNEQRQLVAELVTYGLTQSEIAFTIKHPGTNKHIGLGCFKRHFADEIEHGSPMLKRKVARSLYLKAISKTHPQAVTAAIWFTKARMGWRGEDKITHAIEGSSGVLVAPANTEPHAWIEKARQVSQQRQVEAGIDVDPSRVIDVEVREAG